jgi:hypothetical protein
MEKEMINELKTDWNTEKYKKVQNAILEKLNTLNNLESSLNNCYNTGIKKQDINLSFYKEELKKTLSSDEKIKLCQQFIKDME